MRRKIAIVALVFIVSSLDTAASAGGGRFGLGIILGEPTGIGGKLYLGKDNAIDGAIAWSLDDNDEHIGDYFYHRFDLHIHGDYLYHNYTLIDIEKGELPLYFGIGGRIRLRENHRDKLGIRFPIGLNYIFDTAPFDIFVEVVPVMDLTPKTEFDMNGAIGCRYYF